MPKKSPDEKAPFTCKITKEYCGSRISFISLELRDNNNVLEPKTFFCIPVSEKIVDKIDGNTRRKIQNFIIEQLKIKHAK